jgi:hypothetical protein
MSAASLTDHLTVPAAVIARELDTETVLLNLETGIYFGLDAVGSDMWRAIRSTQTLGDALAVLLTQYEAPADTVRADLLTLAGELLVKQLLQRGA